MKCSGCGEELLDIRDPEILGRENQMWLVCPKILYGCSKSEHTSIYRELCSTIEVK